MKKVLVIFGGCSTEYEVSLVSASAVLSAIDRNSYEVLRMGITRDGRALYHEGLEESIAKDEWQEDKCSPATISMSRKTPMLWVEREGMLEKIPFDIAFPVMHGKNGEDGTIQGLCEMAGIPVAGCGMESSVLGMDKDLAHMLVAQNGIKVPRSVCLQRMEEYGEKKQEIISLGMPVFVKPVRAGSSFGISRVTKEDELQEAIEKAFCHDAQVIVEEGIDGFEVELSQGFFDYEEKYTLKTSSIHMPARIAPGEEEEIRKCAGKIYRILGCRGFTRVDMFFTKDKQIVFNEINTIPGFTSHSRFPNMMKGIGLDFEKVVNEIIRLAE